MDREDLCMDIHPYDLGVVDAISQTLLPGLRNMMIEEDIRAENAERWGVSAERYKLNVSAILATSKGIS